MLRGGKDSRLKLISMSSYCKRTTGQYRTRQNTHEPRKRDDGNIASYRTREGEDTTAIQLGWCEAAARVRVRMVAEVSMKSGWCCIGALLHLQFPALTVRWKAGGCGWQLSSLYKPGSNRLRGEQKGPWDHAGSWRQDGMGWDGMAKCRPGLDRMGMGMGMGVVGMVGMSGGQFRATKVHQGPVFRPNLANRGVIVRLPSPVVINLCRKQPVKLANVDLHPCSPDFDLLDIDRPSPPHPHPPSPSVAMAGFLGHGGRCCWLPYCLPWSSSSFEAACPLEYCQIACNRVIRGACIEMGIRSGI
ncbi:hypothetical protein DL98DRAFT_612196 [Cadophora sp. DSE1049]|nr:hypothetical protein DL98DRAFT_612196 [Cadophora sp. DSE1049]